MDWIIACMKNYFLKFNYVFSYIEANLFFFLFFFFKVS